MSAIVRPPMSKFERASSRPPPGWLLIVLVAGLASALFLTGCASQQGMSFSGGKDAASLPVPASLEPNVDFWRQVYGVWSRGQVAIHDNRYMGIIHEVATLPGTIEESYTASQREWVQERRRFHESRLRALEERVRTGESLSRDERALLAQFEQAGGKAALTGASERVRSQRGLRERFKRGVEISGRYDALFRDIMREHGVLEDLAYLPHVESSFQANARSNVGAAGIWQFMPATGRQFMRIDERIDERLDPIQAAEAAARYLAKAHRRLNSWPLAITAYNHGQGGMASAKAQFGDDIGRIVKEYQGPRFGFASRNFYAEFIAAREVASHPRRYFPEGLSMEPAWSYERLVLRQAMPAAHVANHFGVPTTQLAGLNLHWRDPVRHGRADLPAGSTVWVPRAAMQRVAGRHPPAPVAARVARVEPPAASPAPAAPRASTAAPARAPTAAAAPATPAPRYHVVQPQETLFRVAAVNGLSVNELRRLNNMGPNDNTIRPGQRLRVRG